MWERLFCGNRNGSLLWPCECETLLKPRTNAGPSWCGDGGCSAMSGVGLMGILESPSAAAEGWRISNVNSLMMSE